MPSFFGNKNHTTHFLVVAFPIAIYLLFSAPSGRAVNLYYSTGLLLIVLYITYSLTQSAWFALFAQGVTFFLIYLWLKKNNLYEPPAEKIVWLVGVFLIYCVMANVGPDGFGWFWESESKAGVGYTMKVRLCSWESALENMQGRYWFGWGAGTYPHVNLIYDSCGSEFTRMHNDPLQLLFELGVVGAAIAFLGLGLLFKQAFNTLGASDSDWEKVYALSVIAVLAGCLVQSIFSFPLQWPYILYLVAFVVGGGYVGRLKSPDFVQQKGARLISSLLIVSSIYVFVGWWQTSAAYNQMSRFHKSAETDELDAILFPDHEAMMMYVMGKGLDDLVVQKLLKDGLEDYPNNVRILYLATVFYKEKGELGLANQTGFKLFNISANTGAYTRYLAPYFQMLEKAKGRKAVASVFAQYAASLQKSWVDRDYWHHEDLIQLARFSLRYQQNSLAEFSLNKLLEEFNDIQAVKADIPILMTALHFRKNQLERARWWVQYGLKSVEEDADRAALKSWEKRLGQ